eukprot:197150-Prymnesium_polylepis.1
MDLHGTPRNAREGGRELCEAHRRGSTLPFTCTAWDGSARNPEKRPIEGERELCEATCRCPLRKNERHAPRNRRTHRRQSLRAV